MIQSRNLLLAVVLGLAAVGGWAWSRPRHVVLGEAAVRPNQEDLQPDGGPYNPATQSFLRGHHWLEAVERIEISRAGPVGDLRLHSRQGEQRFSVHNLQLAQLMPRLHYRPASPPDDFDAFNLMLAEYSRNGLSVPVGRKGDEIAHFETTLAAEVPWSLRGDYDFIPNPKLRPLRFAVVNNCLAPGLWEVSASDRAGEIYHAWFDFPLETYYGLLAETNGVGKDFAQRATEWSTRPVRLDLARLRRDLGVVGRSPAALLSDGAVGFSSQDSRRKLSKGYAMVGTPEDLHRPVARSELTAGTVFFSDFIPPGKYSLDKRKPFDLRFLPRPVGAVVRRVEPLTHYRMNDGGPEPDEPELAGGYIEIDLELADHRLVLGNLPLALLVPQEDFALHGFGVGILEASSLAERRQLLVDQGPRPSFAYLVRKGGGNRPLALNSHEHGVEQIFLRTHARDAEPWWEITLTSFERIVDLVKYRVKIPEELVDEARANSREYISPIYLTYKDDNLR